MLQIELKKPDGSIEKIKNIKPRDAGLKSQGIYSFETIFKDAGQYEITSTYENNDISLAFVVNELNIALTELINANAPLYQKEVESISQTQINLLKAVTKGETQFTSTVTMQKYLLGTPRNVSKNKTILINSDVIHEINGKYEFVDPAFELWFNKQFFNKIFTIKK
jgi:hypothetical protein